MFELDEASGIVLAFKYNHVNIYTSVYSVYLFLMICVHVLLAVLGFTDSFKDSDPLSVSGLKTEGDDVLQSIALCCLALIER